MIDIELRLFGNLRKYLDVKLGEGYDLKIENGSTIRTVISLLEIPVNETKIILVNGRPKELDDVLSNSDRLAIFPPVAGG
ncbi:MAG: MoaD/ThiS family protein [Candidatus Bathyarchaeota archaeon]|jgi:molybdopterin converting factor small subunit|nr:MoaD/ThiS family protein [Candidatus Bathyarchaeota archaeon]